MAKELGKEKTSGHRYGRGPENQNAIQRGLRESAAEDDSDESPDPTAENQEKGA